MYEELNLPQIKKLEVQLLKHLDCYCEENRIRYFLSNGTLLGAVKYKGFIPWDDDIDVVMLREDYEAFISKYEDSRYTLFENRRNSSYRYPFAKLSDSTTVLCEQGVNNGVQIGVCIDIFPLDYVGSNYKKAKKIARNLHRVSMLLAFAKKEIEYQGSYNIIKNLMYIFCGIVAKCIKPKTYIKIIQKKAQRYRYSKDSQYLASLCWAAYKEKEVIPAEVFRNSVSLMFEGNNYPVPIGYDKYLKNLYGNYELDPPPEKQVSHHDFKAYKKI